MPDAESAVAQEARRQFEICNACRYCEGYCAVFPAMMRRRAFLEGDLNFLANLCHNCKACYHACQYAPPHAFEVNLPRILAEMRQESYAHYAWPRALGGAFQKNGVVVALVTAAAIALALLIARELGVAQRGAGAFYRVISWAVMSGIAGVALGFSLLALAIGGVRFWRDANGAASAGAVGQAAGEALTLRYLGGGHAGADGCNDTGERFSQLRRVFHHLLFYGFLLCFAATSVATIYHHGLGLIAPYALMSAPVLLGLAGGVGMTLGAVGLLWVKVATDPAPDARRVLGGDYALLLQLLAIAVSGLALLFLRDSAAMPVLLAVHLGLVFAFFLLLPYGKMVHGFYRVLALIKNAEEARRQRGAGGGAEEGTAE
jgi:citrate/tricarballylate utilization protein